MATAAILNFFNTPKSCKYYSGYSYKVDHNMAPKPWISIPNIKIYLETKFRPNRRIFVFGGHFVPWLPWQRSPFWNFFQPPKAATHYGGYSYKVSWSLMKGIQNYFKSPLFWFHGNCGKVCPTDSDFFGLSHFWVFQFFSILAISMAMAAILKIPKVVCTSTHSA
jgi:hypothetical protein